VAGNKLIVSTGEHAGIHATTWTGVLDQTWETTAANGTAAMPLSLGEVAAGIIGKMLYVVGEGNPATLAYNLSTNQWLPANALSTRQFAGNHHAAEVIDGNLYLFGGLGSGSGGKVQIYNPITNVWSPGADMPFAAGSSSSAIIDGQVYVAGGIIGSSTTTQFAKYNPGTNSWTPLPPMPQGRNHAASATDGRRLFIFGGRGPGSGDGNVVANGFNTVQIFDPATNSWESSLTPGSALAPVPQARGGMGKAVYVNGEFYVVGGETLTGPGATPLNVYDRVDIYNPLTNTWRVGTSMPTARHGIFPLAHASRVYVAGGGIQAGGSASAINEIYNANDVVAPVVSNAEFLFEAAPLRVTIAFSENVSGLDAGDLSVQRLPSDPAFSPTGVTYDPASRTATFTLSTPLMDGDYRATLAAGSVTDSSGNALASDHPFEFFVLAGDANRDRSVNLSDFNILVANFGQSNRTFSQGDFNYDTVVTLADFNTLASRFGVALGLQAFDSHPMHIVAENDLRERLDELR
jgi:N-acetylneuraminic acid mutarotase